MPVPLPPPPVILVTPIGLRTGPALPPRAVAQGINKLPPLVRQIPGARAGVGQPAAAPQAAAQLDPARATQLTTIGDRLFRHGNVHRAAERYEQALQADPHSAATRLRLAQVALVRGKYTEAANRLREAQAAQPDWLLHAPDVQRLYGEPTDFAAPIAKLETHLQVEPNDRDAWLVLGAQYFLTGRTRQAADIFQRLADRQADPTLTAFLDATAPAVGQAR
jgi:tetratricopeptide (TPR) repeat protein